MVVCEFWKDDVSYCIGCYAGMTGVVAAVSPPTEEIAG